MCVFTAPLFSSFCALATYLFVKEVRGQGAGLVASALISIVPSYISRSVAGSFDNEGVAIFALVFVFYMYVKVRRRLSPALCPLLLFVHLPTIATWSWSSACISWCATAFALVFVFCLYFLVRRHFRPALSLPHALHGAAAVAVGQAVHLLVLLFL